MKSQNSGPGYTIMLHKQNYFANSRPVMLIKDFLVSKYFICSWIRASAQLMRRVMSSRIPNTKTHPYF